MKIYQIVATKHGFKPCLPVFNKRDVDKALKTCQKGWPNEKWTVFDVIIENRLIHIPEGLPVKIRESLRRSIESNYGGAYGIAADPD